LKIRAFAEINLDQTAEIHKGNLHCKGLNFTNRSRFALEITQPPIQQVSWAIAPRVKWPRCDADNSPPFRTEVKNKWSYAPSIYLPGLHRKNLIIGTHQDKLKNESRRTIV